MRVYQDRAAQQEVSWTSKENLAGNAKERIASRNTKWSPNIFALAAMTN
jgi:hypothetical protein